MDRKALCISTMGTGVHRGAPGRVSGNAASWVLEAMAGGLMQTNQSQEYPERFRF